MKFNGKSDEKEEDFRKIPECPALFFAAKYGTVQIFDYIAKVLMNHETEFSKWNNFKLIDVANPKVKKYLEENPHLQNSYVLDIFNRNNRAEALRSEVERMRM